MLKGPAQLIAFAVDNNPSGVRSAMNKYGFMSDYIPDNESLKTVLMDSYNSGYSIDFLYDVPYVTNAGNYTSQKGTFASSGNKTFFGQVFSNIGNAFTSVTALPSQILNAAGQIVGGAGNIGAMAPGIVGNVTSGFMPPVAPSNTPPQPVATNDDKIMGMDKTTFYILLVVVLAVVGLAIYMMF